MPSYGIKPQVDGTIGIARAACYDSMKDFLYNITSAVEGFVAAGAAAPAEPIPRQPARGGAYDPDSPPLPPGMPGERESPREPSY